jgi:DNA repair exonuclease SbcCD ATPase subunit
VNKKAELEIADRAIKDAEIRLRTIKLHLEALEKEIDALSTLEAQLEENFKYLKKNKVIALASEFKRTKEELQKVKSFLVMRRNDGDAHRKAYKAAVDHLDFCKEKYDQLIKRGENNVIQGTFGRKSDG